MHAIVPKLVDAGIGLAYSNRGAGIAGVWAEFLRQHIRVVEGPGAEFPTWAVDGRAVWVNADWTAGLTGPELQFLIAHEALHVALDHVNEEAARAIGATTPEKRQTLNIAQDAIINQALMDDGIGAMPSGDKRGVTLAQFQAQGYTGPRDSVALYEWLTREQKGGGKGGKGGAQGGKGKGQGKGAQGDQPGQGNALNGCAPSGMPGDEPAPQGEGEAQGKAPAKADPMRQKVRAERARATLREGALKAGEGSAIAELLAPRPTRASVRQLIRQGFERASMNARNRALPSYSRAGRRVLDESIVTPGKIGTEARIAFAADVSGSMSEEGKRTLLGFIESTAREFPDVRVFLVSHTSEVVWKGWLKAGGNLAQAKEATAFTGGTSFAPAYDAIAAERGPRFDALVHFTDGENAGEWPESPARQLIVGLWGSGHDHTPLPAGAKLVPVASVEGDL